MLVELRRHLHPNVLVLFSKCGNQVLGPVVVEVLFDLVAKLLLHRVSIIELPHRSKELEKGLAVIQVRFVSGNQLQLLNY